MNHVSETNRVKTNVPKTDCVTETVFANVCLPLLQAILFLIYFLRKTNRLIRTDKSPYQKLAAKIKAFQPAFEVKRHVPTA